jgi:hypothetical protein
MEPLELGRAFFEHFIRPLALGDVLREAGDPVDLAIVAKDRERPVADPSDRAPRLC